MPNVFNVAKRGLIDGTIDMDANTFEVLLFTTSPSADQGGGEFLTAAQRDLATVSAVEADAGFAEVTGQSSYTANGTSGRMTLGAVTPATDNTNDRATVDAADVTYLALNNFTITGALLYKRVGTAGPTGDATHIPVAYFKLGPTTTNGGDVVIQWATSGFLHLT